MKKLLTAATVFGLAILAGCEVSSPRGGGMTRSDGFNIVVPRPIIELQQGAIQTVEVSVLRGDQFKQDVKLELRPTSGITVEPKSVVVKASASPDAQIRVSAPKDTALGDYRVTVTGTPTSGESTIAEFRVKVIAP